VSTMKDIDWKTIVKEYDSLHGQIRSRGSRLKTEKLTSDEAKERSSNDVTTVEHKSKMFQMGVIEKLTFYYDGCTRHNLNSSNEHIAHVVLRCHEREFEWRKIPFKPRCYIYNDVWRAMCAKVAEIKEQVYEEWEMFERYDGR
jgi:hypothetical protein